MVDPGLSVLRHARLCPNKGLSTETMPIYRVHDLRWLEIGVLSHNNASVGLRLTLVMWRAFLDF